MSKSNFPPIKLGIKSSLLLILNEKSIFWQFCSCFWKWSSLWVCLCLFNLDSWGNMSKQNWYFFKKLHDFWVITISYLFATFFAFICVVILTVLKTSVISFFGFGYFFSWHNHCLKLLNTFLQLWFSTKALIFCFI